MKNFWNSFLGWGDKALAIATTASATAQSYGLPIPPYVTAALAGLTAIHNIFLPEPVKTP